MDELTDMAAPRDGAPRPGRPSIAKKLSGKVAEHRMAALALIIVLVIVVICMFAYYNGYIGGGDGGGGKSGNFGGEAPARQAGKKRRAADTAGDPETEALVDSINASQQ